MPSLSKYSNKILDTIFITEENVLKSLKKLPNKISSGPDGIPPLLLKKIASVIVKPLTLIFRFSFENGVIPLQWLEAKVVPIYKKGENSDPKNYRPISLTVVASKVIEHIIRDYMIKYLLDNNLLNKNQHGFLPNNSTLTNVLSTLNLWIHEIKKISVYICS
ncbi:MAG: hypothetical protein MJA29_11120, partial [Candidatus Omnitrophica bacterium]|nr:hypothetical protein [Candidatus Omnitrophota bacterium]